MKQYIIVLLILGSIIAFSLLTRKTEKFYTNDDDEIHRFGSIVGSNPQNSPQ